MKMRHTRTKLLVATIASAASIATVASRSLLADDDDNGLRAVPAIFIGAAGDCGPEYPAGSHIVTSAWLGGMGLPDNGGLNTTAADLAANANKNDPHRGLLLSKNGPTADCSAAGAAITGFHRGATLSELGFDYRNGGHCGAGAPRFNITSVDGFTYFAGCADGTQSPAPQDAAHWTRVRFTDAQVFPASPTAPPFAFGSSGTEIKSISIVFDEGTDAPSASDPNGVGLAVLDNIDVGGELIRRGSGVADGTNRRGDDDHGDRGGDGKDR
jgi:hypothetical protein